MSETADERYVRLKRADLHWTDWSRFCAAETMCTSPCDDCRREAGKALDASRSR